MKSNSAVWVLGVDSVQDESMEVDVNVQGSAESLHERHRATLPVADAALAARSPAQRREDRAYEDLKDVADQRGIIGQAVAQSDRKGENPLTHRHVREDPIDEVGSGVGHAPAAARAADPPPLARITHNPVLAAGVAVNSKEAAGQHATIEERAQFAFDEPWHGAVTVALPGEEGLQVVGYNAVDRV